jgi:hypothetical protein
MPRIPSAAQAQHRHTDEEANDAAAEPSHQKGDRKRNAGVERQHDGDVRADRHEARLAE